MGIFIKPIGGKKNGKLFIEAYYLDILSLFVFRIDNSKNFLVSLKFGRDPFEPLCVERRLLRRYPV